MTTRTKKMTDAEFEAWACAEEARIKDWMEANLNTPRSEADLVKLLTDFGFRHQFRGPMRVDPKLVDENGHGVYVNIFPKVPGHHRLEPFEGVVAFTEGGYSYC